MSSSDSGAPESLSAYERWELPNIGEETEAEPDLPAPLTAEEIEAMQKQAYEEGFAQGKEAGFAAGVEEARELMEARLQQFDEVLKKLTAPLADLDDTVVEQMAQLAMATARHLVRRELRTDPGQVVAVVREALSALPVGARKVTVALHPDDAALVREAFSVHEEDEDALRWKIVEDPLLTRGGCKVEAEDSRIDASVEKRLNQIIVTVLGGERADDRNA
ncbi:MAG TPA: flagellar assembly protein FliH [Gammaproteobacteria bacterium]|nr:flagellar assembly protein FliH [Gammaproteobacteria bacterium]